MYRIRITKQPGLPQAQAGGSLKMGDQLGHGLYIAPTPGGDSSAYSGGLPRLPEVPRDMANVEVEQKETVWGPFSGDGLGDLLEAGGKRHAQGGTPALVPDGSFVFSDTKKLKIGGPVLKEFGKSENTKQKFTPAQLSKKYDLNRYKDILNNPDSDTLQQQTAGLMASNIMDKLGKLALLQEGMKGFPQGIPEIAMPLVQKMQGGLPPAPSEGGGEGSVASAGMPMEEMDQMSQMGQMGMMGQGEGLPMAQWGGGSWASAFTGGGRRPPQTRPLYEGDFDPGGYRSVVYPGYLPSDHQTNVPWVQQRRTDGLYGTQNWDMNDFYTRHPWVKQARPNFNPANPDDVNWFQNQYNQQYSQLWNRNYFDGTGHRKLDSKFGQGTYSTPSVMQDTGDYMKPSTVRGVPDYVKRDAKVEAKMPYQPYQGPFNKKDTNTALNWKGRGNNDNRWWWQDRFNTGAAIGDYFNLQQDNPTLVSPNAVYSNVSLLDPARQVAAAQEAANSQGMVAAMYAGPQRLRAVTSNIYGQNVPNVGNILGQVHNQNIGLVNANEMANVERANNNEVQRKSALKNYIDEWATVKQQARNSKAQALFNVRNNIVNAKTNADKRNWTNLMNPYYNVDANGRIAFTGYGKGIHSPGSNLTGSDPLSSMKTYLEQYNSMFPSRANTEQAYAFAEKMALGNRSRYGVDSDGDASMSMSGFVPPVQAQALMNMYGRG